MKSSATKMDLILTHLLPSLVNLGRFWISFAVQSFIPIGLIFLLFHLASRNQNSKEPPMLRHWLPHFGFAIPLARDFRGFFTWANIKANGAPFTMIVGGDKYHIFHRPEDVSAIYRKSATLTEIRRGHDIFRKNILRFGKEDVETIAGLRAEEVKVDGIHLLGTEELDAMIVTFVEELDLQLSCFKEELKLARLQKGALEWSGDLMLHATLATLFGRDAFDKHVGLFTDLRAFAGEKWLLRNAGLPDIFAKKATQARKRIKAQLRKVVENLKSGGKSGQMLNGSPSKYIRQRIKVIGDLGVGEDGVVANEFDLVLGANMNSIPMAYITLLHLFSDPYLLKIARREVSSVNWGSITQEARASLLPYGFPRLHALFREVMRYHATTWSLREVQAPTNLELKPPPKSSQHPNPQPQVYELQKGSIIGMPSSLLHYNPDIHENPERFDPERFLAKELGGKGTPVMARTLRPFGGGVSYCPGRKFAERQVLGLVASLILRFDVEIKSEKWEIPRNADFLFVIACKDIEVEVSRRADVTEV